MYLKKINTVMVKTRLVKLKADRFGSEPKYAPKAYLNVASPF